MTCIIVVIKFTFLSFQNYNPNAEEFIPGIANNKAPRSDNRSGFNQANTTSSSNYNKLSPRHKNNSVPAGLNRSLSTPNHQSLSTNPSFENFHRQATPIDNPKKPPNKANRRQFANKVEGRQVNISIYLHISNVIITRLYCINGTKQKILSQFFNRQQMIPDLNQDHGKKQNKHYFMNPNFKQELIIQRLMRLAEVNPDEFGKSKILSLTINQTCKRYY